MHSLLESRQHKTESGFPILNGTSVFWIRPASRNALQRNGLVTFDDFMRCHGEVVDANSRSQVKYVTFEDHPGAYLKTHRNNFRRVNLFSKVPLIKIELENISRLAMAGFTNLEPIAFGWHEKCSFLMLKELVGFISLDKWLMLPSSSRRETRMRLSKALASMLSSMHEAGICHRDLFSWHVFIKDDGMLNIQPIDLERMKTKNAFPLSSWHFNRNKLRDIAALNLTMPWPQVTSAERLRFFLAYLDSPYLTDEHRKMLKQIIAIAKRMAGRRKFRSYGVASRLLRAS